MRKIALTVTACALWAAPAALTASALADVPAQPGQAVAAAEAGASSARIGDDYPYRNGDPRKPDRWNFYQRECTSFVAWRLNQLGVRFHNHYKGVRWSNAKNWDDAARRVGIRVDHRPTVGSVAQRNGGRFGHVAYVAKVSGNRVLLEEYNHRGTHRYKNPPRWINAGEMDNYLHIAR
ncbi:CHAP domain-containing protein [Actinomadura sp. 3N508]|uniref:CHAP domain-containing protein n=1 Tax=Actinomadura sp. 3N508 TaxID=3375153 RepID=UPI0037AF2DF1